MEKLKNGDNPLGYILNHKPDKCKMILENPYLKHLIE